MLTLVAIIGKQVCSLTVIDRPINRLAIGLGMIPRGEVGLIFAGIGATHMLPNTQSLNDPVINSATFGAVVIMVIITTLITLPELKWPLQRSRVGQRLKQIQSPDHMVCASVFHQAVKSGCHTPIVPIHVHLQVRQID